jgi:hypothetical protein
MRPATLETIFRTLRHVPDDKAPGRDGISSAILKLLIGPELEELAPTPPMLRVMQMLTNESLRLGHVPRHAKDGLIRMIPKGGGSGVLVTDVSEMRPITLLSELGKVTSRILAERMATVFANIPSLLHPSQRAFQRNGDTGQCVDMALDVIEDYWDTKSKDSHLFCLSYDQAKAFDGVQEYSIRHSLQRFGLPDKAISFFCSTLVDAESSVITEAGHSRRFPVLTSVRQGDPCAPLIFIMVADVLHRGYSELRSQAGVGYTFQNEPTEPLTVTSCGYADDVMIFAESVEGLLAMHQWTREFFGAHAFKLNTKKTKLTCTSGHNSMSGRFYGVSGHKAIIPIPASEDFRYLGIRIALDGSWDAEIRRLQGQVDRVRASIRTHRMLCPQAVDAVNAFLVPQIDLGIRIIPHSTNFMNLLRIWRDKLQDTILQTQQTWLTRPNRSAFCEVTGMVDLPRYCAHNRAAIMLQRLNTRDNVLPPTAWARLAAISPGSSRTDLLDKVNARRRPSGKNRIVDALIAHGLGNVVYKYNSENFDVSPVEESLEPAKGLPIEHVRTEWWNPTLSPNRIFSTDCKDLVYHVYPDGSTTPGRNGKSGYAAVIVDQYGRSAVAGSGIKRSGTNYMAEMMGILAGILACPGQSTVHVHTDCLGGMQAVMRRDRTTQFARLHELGLADCCVSEPERIRAGARPVLTSIRKVIDARQGVVNFHHVRSHTLASDKHSYWNAVADKNANLYRAKGGAGASTFLWNEERVVVALNGDHVHGDFKKWAKREAAALRRMTWKGAEGHVSTVIRECPEGIQPLCAIVRKRGDNEETLLLLEALCSRVPCGHRFGRTRDGPTWPNGIWSCHACNAQGTETTDHILLCPATDGLRRTAVEALLHDTLPGHTVRARSAPSTSPRELWVRDLRLTLALTRQVDTTPATRDRLFTEWCPRGPCDARTGAPCARRDSSWSGQFMLATPPVEQAARALQRALAATAAHRPTRVVVAFPKARASQSHTIIGAHWIGHTHEMMFALFQNGLAEAVSPCREKLRDLASRQCVVKQEWDVNECAWPGLSLKAWSLDRARRSPHRPILGWAQYFDAGDLSGVGSDFMLSLFSGAELRYVCQLSKYTRRLGVLPDNYGSVLSEAIEKATGQRPSLRRVSSALDSLRASLWNSASAAFRTARAARAWVYDNDPKDTVDNAESDCLAQRLFERKRDAPRIANGPKQPLPEIHYRYRRRKVQSQIDSDKAQSSTRAVATSQEQNAPKQTETRVRRSTRGRIPKRLSGVYWWNLADTYVQALDEMNAPTSGRIHARNAERKRRARRALRALI